MVRSKLGMGGMAEVFLAEAVDAQGEQVQVALKLMRQGITEEQFADEADLMGMLSHPNLVQRLEVGNAFGRHFIAMEFLIGGDLREVMNAHREQMREMPTTMAVHATLEVLKALAYFHQATSRSGAPLNLVHSDVNPANVFFGGNGEVKLGDFGVASSSRASIGPGEGVAAGKLSYLSPEQTRGEKVGPQSDLWAVGVTLYEMVVGYHPFLKEGLTEAQAMQAIRAAKFQVPDYVDKALAQILARALSPDLKNRFKTAGEFGGALFQYALDRNLHQHPSQVQAWLEGVLGLLV